MDFELPAYHAPNFQEQRFRDAPDARWVPAPGDGIAPEDYHATSIFPEYFKVNGTWVFAQDSRMDSVAVLGEDGKIAVVEFRNLKKADRVFVGRTENAEKGIFLHLDGFGKEKEGGDAFAFRTGRSRETAYSRDYDFLYRLLLHEKEHGFIVWVLGPACSFDSDSRQALAWLISNGYADALLAGNALATHDLEAGLFQTALGQNIYTQKAQPLGHYNHLDAINRVRACGSIPAFIDRYHIPDGIMRSCVKKRVPFVLAGSIRDNGPLPEVYGNVYEAQNAMRDQLRKATTVICMATQLHSIAAGNMMPTFRVVDHTIRPTFFYCVDISEFVVNKLRDRGSLSVTTIVANIQDFIVNLQKGTRSLQEGK